MRKPRFPSEVDLPLVDGRYEWADGKSVDTYDSTVVVINTDAKGIEGYAQTYNYHVHEL